MEGYTVEEMEVRSEEVRRAIGSGRIGLKRMIRRNQLFIGLLTIALALLGMVVASYIECQEYNLDSILAHITDLQGQQHATKSELAVLTDRFEVLDETVWSMEYAVDDLKDTVYNDSTVATETPTPAPTPEPGYAVETKAVGNLDFGGNIFVEFRLVDGIMTKSEAIARKQSMFEELLSNCDGGSSSLYSSNRDDSSVLHLYGSKRDPIEGRCFRYVGTLGTVTNIGLPRDVVEELMKYEMRWNGIEEWAYNTLVFLSKADGHAIAAIQHAQQLPVMDSCLDFSLRQVGWNGEEYFILNTFNLPKEARELLYRNAVISLEEGAPDMPDYCGAQSLKEIPQPLWLKTEPGGDALKVTLGQLKARIHSDPSICDIYPEGWESGKHLLDVLVDGKYEPIAVFGDDDLVLFDALFGKTEGIVYLTFEGGTPKWLTPRSEGIDPYRFQRIPAIWLNPSVDGIGPWIQIQESPLPYTLDGRIVTQIPATVPFGR